MTARTVTVTNPLGMHARAAAKFVHTASSFLSQIRVA
jgi:phosphotransferase system HPr (HPr) family protein